METTKPFIHDKMPQAFYDAFNEFMFGRDIKSYNKLISKIFFLNLVKSLPGDIIELGVFKGSGMMAWLKAIHSFGINNKRVIGFDIFDEEKLTSGINTVDKETMRSLFEQRSFQSIGYKKTLEDKIRNAGYNNFELVEGDVFQTIPVMTESRPGLRACIINFDLDLYEPTKFCLENLWNNVTPGGILIFDEYSIDEWTESNAVDEFIAGKNLQLIRTNFESPSAYIIKMSGNE